MSTGTLEYNLRMLAAEGVMISIWPTRSEQYQANVSEPGDNSWTCHTDPDPMVALATALRHRLAGVTSRIVTRASIRDNLGEQVDIEDAIAAANSVSYTEQVGNIDDDDEDLIG